MARNPDDRISDKETPGDAQAADASTRSAVARVRLLMLISAATTGIAIAAVLGVIGYRVYAAGGESGAGAGTITNGTVFLPKGAHVISTTIGGGRIVVTFEVNGATEVRIFDLKTMQQTGRLSFATEH